MRRSISLSAAISLIWLATQSPSTADVVGSKDAETRSGFVSSVDGEVRPFEVDDIFRIEYAVDPRISPDGEQVVFVRETVDILDDRWHGHLWSVTTDGGKLRQITAGHHYDSSPRISSDGKRIAFLSDRDGGLQIYVKPLAAGTHQPARRVSNLADGEPWGLAWSPDSTTLSFIAREHAGAPQLGYLSPPPPGASWAEPPRVIDRLLYRRDGRGYLEAGCDRLFLLPVAGGEARRATRVEDCLDEATLDMLNHERDGGGAVWTPDGRYLIVAANRRAARDRRQHPVDLDLYEVEIDSGELRPLVTRQGLDSLPTVSPDGTKIAFVGFDDRGMSHQSAELYVANRDGSGTRSLTATLGRDVESPRWAADGTALLVLYHDRGTTRISRVEMDGSITVVADGVSDGYGAYDGGGFTLSHGGRLAFTHSQPGLAGEVAVAQVVKAPDISPIRRLTGLNAELMAERRVATVEEIRFAAADGHQIQGWLVRPTMEVTGPPGTPPPMILDIHGGPFLNYGARFDLEKQILASHGFAVLYVNPRGSTGYGEKFANLIHRNYPGDDLFDLLAAVDLMVTREEAHPDRLFVAGGSGGALLALSLIAETSRFKAAVAFYPLVNWTTFVLSSDFAPVALARWLPGPPWQHRDHYLERSPIWQVDRMETPTLVIGGEDDDRTPISEAQQIFAALQIRGVDSVLVRLPETHHFSERRPSHHRARIAYGLHWFERYLQPFLKSPSESVEVPVPPDPR